MAGPGSQDEIRKLLDELIEARNSGDAPRLRTVLSERDDGVHIGTDAGEWWTSSQLIDAVAAAGGGDDIRAVSDDVDVHVQGDIALGRGARTCGWRLRAVRRCSALLAAMRDRAVDPGRQVLQRAVPAQEMDRAQVRIPGSWQSSGGCSPGQASCSVAR